MRTFAKLSQVPEDEQLSRREAYAVAQQLANRFRGDYVVTQHVRGWYEVYSLHFWLYWYTFNHYLTEAGFRVHRQYLNVRAIIEPNRPLGGTSHG